MVTRPFILLELQDAVHALLKGDTLLMGMVTGIHDADAVPLNAPFPYITYGTHVDQSWPTYCDHLNSDALFQMSIWSDVSRAECYGLLAEIRRILDPNPAHPVKIVMPDYGSCMFQYEWSTVLYNLDTKFWTAPLRYHAYSTELD